MAELEHRSELERHAEAKIEAGELPAAFRGSTRAGGGMQIPVADLDGDGHLDFAVAGKSGLFLFENLTRKK